MDLTEINRSQFEQQFRMGELTGSQLLKFFDAVECPVRWIRAMEPDLMVVGLIVKPASVALTEGLGLLFEVPVIVSRHAQFQARTMQYRGQMERAVVKGRLEREVSIVLSDDVLLPDKLEKLDGLFQIHIGLSCAWISQAMIGSEPSILFRKLLQKKLFARDAFDRTGPVEGRDFFGRRAIQADLLSQLGKGSSVGLYGLRKIGKTSILHNLAESARGKGLNYYFATIDLLSATRGNRTYLYLLWVIANELSAQVNLEVRTSAGLRTIGRIPRFEDVRDARAFEVSLDSDLKALAKHLEPSNGRVVIIIDEIELLFPLTDIREGFQGYEDFLTYLRGLSQNNRISIMVVGVNPNISEAQYLGKGRRNPMYGFFSNRYATSMPLEEVREMVKVLGTLSGARFEADAIDRLYAVTLGHPALTRKYCSVLIRDKTRPVTLTKDDVDKSRDQFLRDESNSLAEMVSVVREYYPEEFAIFVRVAMSESGLPVGEVNRQTRSHLQGYQLVHEKDGQLILSNELMRDWFSGLRSAPRMISEDSPPVADPGTQAALDQAIKGLERELRRFIATRLLDKYGVSSEKRIDIGLGAGDAKVARDRRDQSLRKFQAEEPATQLGLIDYLYMGDLFKLICGPDWALFREAFNQDKKKVDYACSVIVPARNELAHGRDLRERDVRRALIEVEDVLEFVRSSK